MRILRSLVWCWYDLSDRWCLCSTDGAPLLWVVSRLNWRMQGRGMYINAFKTSLELAGYFKEVLTHSYLPVQTSVLPVFQQCAQDLTWPASCPSTSRCPKREAGTGLCLASSPCALPAEPPRCSGFLGKERSPSAFLHPTTPCNGCCCVTLQQLNSLSISCRFR